MRIDGGCHCGNLSYEAEIEPAQVGAPKVQLWCRSALPWVMNLGAVAQRSM